MAIKKYGPTTPGRRGMTVTDYSVLSKVAPERSLLEPMKKHSGRNNTGRITVRHQGGGSFYELTDAILTATYPLGVSNEYAEGSDCITVSTRTGALVVVETLADGPVC